MLAPFCCSFKTSKGVGYTAHFVGNCLVLTSLKVKGKGYQHCIKYEFQPRKWYMVAVVYIYNRWSRSEIKVFVNGQLASATEMTWLVNTNDAWDKCHIGATPELDEERVFCGQMSVVYLFSEALSTHQVCAMHRLGPGYKSQFRFDTESSMQLPENLRRVSGNFFYRTWHCVVSYSVDGELHYDKALFLHHVVVLYDGKLASAIVFMYNPVATDSQLCLQSSPKGNPSYFKHSPHALMLQDVKAVVTHSIHSTLSSLGGIQVLFPLFQQLDMPHDQASAGQDYCNTPTPDPALCATLVGFICEMVEASSTVQQHMAQNRGFLVVAHLLHRASRHHITMDVLTAFLKLTKFLVTSPKPNSDLLLKQMLDHILFNPSLWIYCPVAVQLRLHTYLATEFLSDTQIYGSVRRVSTVLQTMHALKYYYWVVNPRDKSGINPKGLDGPRPCEKDIVSLRAYMLLFLKQLIMVGSGVKDDELQAILNYLSTMHEDENLHDVLQMLMSLMSEQPASMVPAFDSKVGTRTVFKLLASSSQLVRLQALKLLGFFLSRSTHKRKYDVMNPHNLYTLLAERLLAHDEALDLPTYNCLYELLTEQISQQVLYCKHPEPESHYRLENPMILKVCATLIRQSKPSDALLEVKKLFLSDMTILCNNNRDNRRTVLQMSVWQEWLIALAYIHPRSSEEQKISDMVYSLFRMLLHHAIKYEYGGWRVWVDTLAIVHSKVSYEEFKLQFAQMYEQYERHRSDNITDPAIRQQRPISTISGWERQYYAPPDLYNPQGQQSNLEDGSGDVKQDLAMQNGEMTSESPEYLPEHQAPIEEVRVADPSPVGANEEASTTALENDATNNNNNTITASTGNPTQRLQDEADVNAANSVETSNIVNNNMQADSTIEGYEPDITKTSAIRSPSKSNNNENNLSETTDNESTPIEKQHENETKEITPDFKTEIPSENEQKTTSTEPENDGVDLDNLSSTKSEEKTSAASSPVKHVTERENEQEKSSTKDASDEEMVTPDELREINKDPSSCDSSSPSKLSLSPSSSPEKCAEEKVTGTDKSSESTPPKSPETASSAPKDDSELEETAPQQEAISTISGIIAELTKTEKDKADAEDPSKDQIQDEATPSDVPSNTETSNSPDHTDKDAKSAENTVDPKSDKDVGECAEESNGEDVGNHDVKKGEQELATVVVEDMVESKEIVESVVDKPIEECKEKDENSDTISSVENDVPEAGSSASDKEPSCDNVNTVQNPVNTSKSSPIDFDKSSCEDAETATLEVSSNVEVSFSPSSPSKNTVATSEDKTLRSPVKSGGDELQELEKTETSPVEVELAPEAESVESRDAAELTDAEVQPMNIEASSESITKDSESNLSASSTPAHHSKISRDSDDTECIAPLETPEVTSTELELVIPATKIGSPCLSTECLTSEKIGPDDSPDSKSEATAITDQSTLSSSDPSTVSAVTVVHQPAPPEITQQLHPDQNKENIQILIEDQPDVVPQRHNIGIGISTSDRDKAGQNDPAADGKSSSVSRSSSVGSSQSNSRQIFNSGPTRPPFRIPEFRWSYIHQRLLSDVLFSLETDMQVWRSHSTKSVLDFVNNSENAIFVVNTVHLISQLADNLIIACGGLLPLLASATSPNSELEVLEPTQGLVVEAAVSFLHRLVNMADVLVFASSLNFSELEAEKNMSSGGILRQCLRLVCTVAVRNCLECRERSRITESAAFKHPNNNNNNANGKARPVHSMMRGAHSSPKNLVEQLGGASSPVRDPEKLLQDMDVNRLRAVIYRDVEETKQAQFLSLAIVYFISVLMVSKYRDILEPPSSATPPSSAQTTAHHNNFSHHHFSAALDSRKKTSRPGKVVRSVSASSLKKEDDSINTNESITCPDACPTPTSLIENSENEKVSASKNASPKLKHQNNMSDDGLDVKNSQIERSSTPAAFEKRLSVGQLSTLSKDEDVSEKVSFSGEEREESSPVSTSVMLSVHNTSQCHPVSLAIINPDAAEKAQTSPNTSIKSAIKMRQTTVLTAKKRRVTLYPACQQTAMLKRFEEIERLQEVLPQIFVSESNEEDLTKETSDSERSNGGSGAGNSVGVEDDAEYEMIMVDQHNSSILADHPPSSVNSSGPPSIKSPPMLGGHSSLAGKYERDSGPYYHSGKTMQPSHACVPHKGSEGCDGGSDGGSATSLGDETTDAAWTDVSLHDGPGEDDHKPMHSSEVGEYGAAPGQISVLSSPTNIPDPSSVHQHRPEDLHIKSFLHTELPVPAASREASLTQKLEMALGSVSPLLREIMVDFAPFLSKTLVGSHGQELLLEGLTTFKQSQSVVELVMLLCSQEWQNSLQKHAGLAFIELINEGSYTLPSDVLAEDDSKHVTGKTLTSCLEYIGPLRSNSSLKSLCATTVLERREEERMCDHLITAARRRDNVVAARILDKLTNILASRESTSTTAATANARQLSPKKGPVMYWKLDSWEDDSRRRKRFVPNPLGSSHPEATLKAALEHGAPEDAIMQAREEFHTQLAAQRRAQQQTLQSPDLLDDSELTQDDRDLDADLTGVVNVSTRARLVAPGLVVPGTVSITASELYFEVDEDDPEYRKCDLEGRLMLVFRLPPN
ncbi:protein of unknown function DUF4704 [Trinorchestia longiramus]|nr:protein of unknown function DUF4704 [Trinorchestia longiramus]